MRHWTCVLLVLLILYNPFAALTTSYGSFSVHGQARHRATVGASELQHLGCAQDQSQKDMVSFHGFREMFAGRVVEFEAVGLYRDVEVPQPDSVNRIWSRPPPLV